jgi:hypothetical protein
MTDFQGRQESNFKIFISKSFITNFIANLDLMLACKSRSLLIIQQLQCITCLTSRPIRRVFVWRDRYSSPSPSFPNLCSSFDSSFPNASLSALILLPPHQLISPFSPLISLSPSFPNSFLSPLTGVRGRNP